ncbi:MAG: hypothetical protein ACE5HI_14220 [bacterium]
MSQTLGYYLAATRNYLNEQDPNQSFWKQEFLKQLFNAAYRRRSAQMMQAFEGWFINVAVRDLTADQAIYSWPSNFQRCTKLELVRSDGRTVPIEALERHFHSNARPTPATDQYFPTYRPLGNGFVLEPAPQTDFAGGLKIEYEGLPAQLSAESDRLHPSWPIIYEELLVLDTAVAAFDAEQMLEAGGQPRSLLRLRNEFEIDFLAFIDRRMATRTQRIIPFRSHYEDG